MATSVSGGGSRREPPTLGKQLVNFITCAANRVHPFCNLQSWARTNAILVIGLYELLDPTTKLIEPPGHLCQSENSSCCLLGIDILIFSRFIDDLSVASMNPDVIPYKMS
jgi:hypothetical protein